MHIRALTGLALSGALVLAGCVQDRASEPLLPTEVSLAASPAACSWSEMTKVAKLYFSNTKDPVYLLLDKYQAAYRTGVAATISGAAFDVLARIGVATDAGLVKAGAMAAGSNLANMVIACKEAPTVWTSIDFSKALDAGGLFAVRPVGSSAAVFSRHVGGPLYGAEPMPVTAPAVATWPISETRLFFGYPLATVTLPTEDFRDYTLETPAGATFELSTYPNLPFSTEMRAGVCNPTSASARMFHQHGSADKILPPAGSPSFCVEPSESVGFASLTRRVVDLFLPQPLHAAMFTHGASGGLKSLSPIGAVTFTPLVTFVDSIVDSQVSLNPQYASIQVKAVTSLNTPLVGFAILLAVDGNSGSFTPIDTVAITDAAGVATFTNVYLDKAGGYVLRATLTDLGVFKLSNLFQISGQ